MTVSTLSAQTTQGFVPVGDDSNWALVAVVLGAVCYGCVRALDWLQGREHSTQK